MEFRNSKLSFVTKVLLLINFYYSDVIYGYKCYKWRANNNFTIIQKFSNERFQCKTMRVIAAAYF